MKELIIKYLNRHYMLEDCKILELDTFKVCTIDVLGGIISRYFGINIIESLKICIIWYDDKKYYQFYLDNNIKYRIFAV